MWDHGKRLGVVRFTHLYVYVCVCVCVFLLFLSLLCFSLRTCFRSGEIVMLHRSSKTLIISDLLYKSNPQVVGPGGGINPYVKEPALIANVLAADVGCRS